MPAPRNTVDFVVITFVVTVAAILIIGTVFLVFAELINPDQDHSSAVNSLTDTLNTIIGALIGFVAGKGYIRTEKEDETKTRDNDDSDSS